MKPHPQLKTFIAPYDRGIQELALELRDFIVHLVPQANELIWDNYNAVAMAYSKSEKLSDAFCHLAIYAKHVNFGFNRGAEVTQGRLHLKGSGTLIRHITVKNYEAFPKREVEKLVWEAVGISEKRNNQLSNPSSPPKSIVMSMSEKKIRPNPR